MHFQQIFGPSIQPPTTGHPQMFQLCGCPPQLLDISALIGLISILSTLIVVGSGRFVTQLAGLQFLLVTASITLTFYLCYCWRFERSEVHKCSKSFSLCQLWMDECLRDLNLAIWHSSVSSAVTVLSSKSQI